MASRSDKVMRGIRIPLVVDCTSSMAEPSGGVFVLLIATPWAKGPAAQQDKIHEIIRIVSVLIGLVIGRN
jgi:hypothetical protein